jgi:hypothetical protein
MLEACEPNVVVNLFDAELLAGQDGRDIDPLAIRAEAAAGGDDDIAIV